MITRRAGLHFRARLDRLGREGVVEEQTENSTHWEVVSHCAGRGTERGHCLAARAHFLVRMGPVWPDEARRWG